MNSSQRKELYELQNKAKKMETFSIPSIKPQNAITITPKEIIQINDHNIITILSNKENYCQSYKDSIQSAVNILETHKTRLQIVKNEVSLITEDSNRIQFMSDIKRIEQSITDLEILIKKSNYENKNTEISNLLKEYKDIHDQDPKSTELSNLSKEIITIEKELLENNKLIQENLMNLDIGLFQQYSEYINPQEKTSSRKNPFKKIFGKK